MPSRKNKAETEKFSRRERQIMDILFSLERATVNDIQSRLPDPPPTPPFALSLKSSKKKATSPAQSKAASSSTPPKPQNPPQAYPLYSVSSQPSTKAPSNKHSPRIFPTKTTNYPTTNSKTSISSSPPPVSKAANPYHSPQSES